MLVLQKRNGARDHHDFILSPTSFEAKSDRCPTGATLVDYTTHITTRARENGAIAFYFEGKQTTWSTSEYLRIDIWASNTSQGGGAS